MQCYRKTKALINLGAIRRNTQRIIRKYPDYTYYMAVVKADCYGYRGNRVVKAMLDGGANCLAASLPEEGMELRNDFPEIPILLFTPVDKEYLPLCAERGLMVTVANENQAVDAAEADGLEVAVRVNGGNDILGGPLEKPAFDRMIKTLQQGRCQMVGCYLHNYCTESESDTAQEYQTFERLTRNMDLSALRFVSVSNSLSLPRYEKRDYCNACRLGNILYRIESEDDELEHTFRLESRVLSVFELNKGQSVAYSHAYTATRDNEYIAAVPIGFGDGFAKSNIGRDVYIDGKRYPIVAVTMDITLVLVDASVQKDDLCELIRENHHLEEISAHIHGATEEPIVAINKRVCRVYVDDEKENS